MRTRRWVRPGSWGRWRGWPSPSCSSGPPTWCCPRPGSASGPPSGAEWSPGRPSNSPRASTPGRHHLFRFQAVYGSIAAVFVFLLWIYLSWTIFLFGARLAFVFQHHRALVEQEEQGNAMGRELLAVRALLEVALSWLDGAKPPDAGEVADRIDVAAEPVRDVLATLEEAGFLTESDEGRLTPARPLDRSPWPTFAASSPGHLRTPPTGARLRCSRRSSTRERRRPSRGSPGRRWRTSARRSGPPLPGSPRRGSCPGRGSPTHPCIKLAEFPGLG